MKKSSLKIACIAVVVSIAASCSLPFMNQQQHAIEQGYGAVQVAFQGAERMLVPDLSFNVDAIELRFEHDEHQDVVVNTAELSHNIQLPAGDWNITAVTFNPDGAAVFTGQTTVSVTGAKTAQAVIELSFIAGAGELQLTVEVDGPGEDFSLSGRLEPADVQNSSRQLAFGAYDQHGSLFALDQADIASGYYTLHLDFSANDQVVANGMETVLIAADSATSGQLQFAMDAAGRWYMGEPDWKTVPEPVITISPDAGTYTGTRTVSIMVEHADTATMTFAGSSHDFTDSYSFELSQYLSDEQSSTLTVSATNARTTVQQSIELTRIDDISPERIDDFNNLRIYQIMVSSFQNGDSNLGYYTGYGPSEHGGDLIGITNAIPYIAGLGMNAIWMTPVFETYGHDQLASTGYFANNFFAIDPEFGTLDDMKNLVAAANEHGLYVFFDGVFGHHNGSGDIPASPSGYTVSGGSDPVSYPGSLNFFREVATWWIDEVGIDGWRLDQAYQLTPYSGQDRSYWPDIREAVEQLSQQRRDAGEQWGVLGYMVGEIWSGEQEINDYGYDGGNGQIGLRSNFDFPLRYRLVQVLATQEWTTLDGNPIAGANQQPASWLDDGFTSHDAYPDFAKPNLMLGNHDLLRFGDLIKRAPHLDYGSENQDYWLRHKAALSFLAAYTGPITLYYGDEIGDYSPWYGYNGHTTGSNNHGDSGHWDDNVSRTDGRISGFSSNEQDLHDYVQALMHLRAANPALWNGERQNLIAGTERYADLKSDPDSDDRMVYVLNVGLNERSFSINASTVGGSSMTDALTGHTVSPSGGNYSFTVPRLSARFFYVE